jgi:uncharacterized membrane protein
MDLPILSVTIVGLAAGGLLLAPPFNVIAIAALAVMALFNCWTRKRALERVAQGVTDKFDQELEEAIAEARRRHGGL